MTEEQMSMMKKLIKKHGIGATDGEWLLVYLGVRYGLLEQQVDEYLTLDTTELLIKHEKMLCIIYLSGPILFFNFILDYFLECFFIILRFFSLIYH